MLLTLGAVWSDSEMGKEIMKGLPGKIHKYPGEGKIKLIFLLETPKSRIPLLVPVKDRLNQIMRGRIRLYGLRHITLVDFETAQKMDLPVPRL
jgi:hypothetical protein